MFVQDNNWASYHEINSEGMLTELTYWRHSRHPCTFLLRSIAGQQRFSVTRIYARRQPQILCSYHQTTYSMDIGGGFPEGGLRPVNEAITRLYLVQRLRMNTILPCMPSLLTQGLYQRIALRGNYARHYIWRKCRSIRKKKVFQQSNHGMGLVQGYPEGGSSTCLQNRGTYIRPTSLHGVIYRKNGKFLKKNSFPPPTFLLLT